MNTSEQVSVNRKFQKISSADIENRGVAKVFEEVAIDDKVNVNRSINTANRVPMKMLDNQTSIDSRPWLMKQTGADSALSSRCSETDAVPASSRHVQEKRLEVQSLVGPLSGGLTTEEVHHVYSRVFYRR